MQAVVDENAVELLADCLVDQHGCDGAIDAAGKPADYPFDTNLLLDCRDRLVREKNPSSSRLDAGYLGHEVLQDSFAVRRVRHFRVELDGIELPRFSSAIAAKGAPGNVPTTRKPGGNGDDAIAVAHPYLMALARPTHLRKGGVFLIPT